LAIGEPSFTLRRLGCRQGCFRALARPAGFVFCHSTEYVKCEAGSERLIASGEVDACIHEVGNKGDVSCQAIKFGNQQGGMAADLRDCWNSIRGMSM